MHISHVFDQLRKLVGSKPTFTPSPSSTTLQKEAAACWLQLGGNPLAHSSSGTPYVLLLGDAATKGFWLQQVGWTSAMLHIFSSPLAWSLLLTALGLSAALLLLRGPRPCDVDGAPDGFEAGVRKLIARTQRGSRAPARWGWWFRWLEAMCNVVICAVSGPLVRWSAGPPVRRFAGPRVRWSAGPLVAGPPVRRSAGSPVRWSAGPLVRWSAGPLVRRPPVRWSAGPLVRWSAGPRSAAPSSHGCARPVVRSAVPVVYKLDMERFFCSSDSNIRQRLTINLVGPALQA